jgi:hypothetical protein
LQASAQAGHNRRDALGLAVVSGKATVVGPSEQYSANYLDIDPAIRDEATHSERLLIQLMVSTSAHWPNAPFSLIEGAWPLA